MLSELSEKIFYDRYSLKDPDKNNIQIGDTVVVAIEGEKYERREIGEVISRHERQIQVKLKDENIITTDIGKADRPLESSMDEMFQRVAKAVASVEKDSKKWENVFYESMQKHLFIPGGRILAGAGSFGNLTLFNCFTLPYPKDSRQGILETLGEMTEIMSRGGGVGINISSLRPRTAYVRKVNGRSSGSVSWGSLYSFVTGLVEQGGSRRGALILILEDWHPDIFDFINSKRESGKITNANISVGISDKFMNAVKNDLDWNLVFPDTTYENYDEEWDGNLDEWITNGKPIIHYKTVKAKELWLNIIESAWASAEPGLWFIERSNKMSNSFYFNRIVSVNPCGEVPLTGHGVCNLGAINLSKMWDFENKKLNVELLTETIKSSVRFLDNVIDVTPYFIDKNERVQKGERRLGLNTMGIGELMIQAGIRYGSKESLSFIDEIYTIIRDVAYITSVELAKEKGVFPDYSVEILNSEFIKTLSPEIKKAIKENGLRNVNMMTQAPNGSIASMLETSTGIEPFFSFKYYRKSRLGLHEENVKIAQDWLDSHPNQELPDYFVTAMNLSPEDHVRVQAQIQKYVDLAISKTANVPHDYTIEQTAKLYELMYDLGCKGGTIYRDGSRDEQVLMLKVEEEKPKPKKRPEIVSGKTLNMKTSFGTVNLTINEHEGNPYEVFIIVGKGGTDIQGFAEGIGRLISFHLKNNGDGRTALKEIADQLDNIGGANPYGIGKKKVLSLPDAVAKLLKRYLGEEIQVEENSKTSNNLDLCPSCGNMSLAHVEGCKTCTSCGYSAC